jgi:hypothetical protein
MKVEIDWWRVHSLMRTAYKDSFLLFRDNVEGFSIRVPFRIAASPPGEGSCKMPLSY